MPQLLHMHDKMRPLLLFPHEIPTHIRLGIFYIMHDIRFWMNGTLVHPVRPFSLSTSAEYSVYEVMHLRSSSEAAITAERRMNLSRDEYIAR